MDRRGGGALLPRVPSRLDEPRFDLAAIYRHHHRLVRWMVRGAGVPEHAVDDVTQDVFVAIHRRRAQAPGAGLRRWVVGVTRSVCHSYRRAGARSRQRLARTIEPEPSPLPDDLLDGRTALHRLRGVLDGLAEPQREVFVLMELEGLSAPETAEALGANLSTVYSRLRLARQRVWAELAPAPELVASAREAGRPRREEARHSWLVVVARIGGEASSIAPVAAAASAATGKVGGLAIGVCLGVAVLGGLLVARGPARSRDLRNEAVATAGPPQAVSPARAAVPDEPSPAASEPAAAVIERRLPPTVDDAPPARPRSSARASEPMLGSSLADEAELLRRAASSLDAADLDEAARLLDAHADRFADGELADERERLLAELERRRSGDASGRTAR